LVLGVDRFALSFVLGRVRVGLLSHAVDFVLA
jgi:hypothetical protein